MARERVREEIIKEYKLRYPDWTDIQIKDFVDNYQGTVAVVAAKMAVATYDNEEVCYIARDGSIRIFDTTVELLNFLHRKAQPRLLERLTAQPVVAAFVFVGVLIGLFSLVAFKNDINEKVLASLTSVVGVAAGFFFGSAKAQDP